MRALLRRRPQILVSVHVDLNKTIGSRRKDFGRNYLHKFHVKASYLLGPKLLPIHPGKAVIMDSG